MSTPALSAATCRCWLTPPKMVVLLSPYAAASGSMTAVIWVASSRVGASTSASGRPARRCPPASLPPRRETIGIANARVLPEPVLPRPSTSRPFMVSGRVSTWIGKASVLPCASSTATRGAGTPSAPKVVEISDMGVSFMLGASDWYSDELARVTVATIDRRESIYEPFWIKGEKRKRSTTQANRRGLQVRQE